MAKKRKGTSTQIVRYTAPPRGAAPIVNVRVPRAASGTTHHKKKKGHRRHHNGDGGLNQGAMQKHAIGGFLYGVVEKNFGTQIPTLPMIGRAGSIALGCYFFGKGRGGIIADVGKAAAVIAGYQFGTTGKISGDIPSQVRGIAAQV